MSNCKYGYVILHVIHIYIHTCIHARFIPYISGGEEAKRRVLSREVCNILLSNVLMSLTSNFLAKHLVRSVRTTHTRAHCVSLDAGAPVDASREHANHAPGHGINPPTPPCCRRRRNTFYTLMFASFERDPNFYQSRPA